ncbi:MAG: sigma-54 dependent transcriptional regulator [Desulfobacterales bacterium]|nr:sigma-54 dependent transcriptional regulator [Desulfobacterales bacterium]
MPSKTKILFVDDDPAVRRLFSAGLRTEKALEIESASNGRDALQKLAGFPADIVISDVQMPQMDGMTLLDEIRARYPDIFVLLITGQGAIEESVKAMKAGAYDYLLKPFDFKKIRRILARITDQKSALLKSLPSAKEQRQKHRFENIIGQDPKIFDIFQRVENVAAANATVLITGETGTGKELIADAIHYKSPRRNGPFVKVNCAALTETLINSELFGHEKGAFTGATAQKKGHFEIGDKGDIFLDEIGDIPASTQTSLLRVLETGTFQRVGGTQTLQVDARFICATNKDLSKMVKENLFREDLLYRIKVVSLHMPPLRERKGDILILARHYLKIHCDRSEKKTPPISREAIEMLNRYDWPGNVRELVNVMEHAMIFCKGSAITPADLPEDMTGSLQKKPFKFTISSRSLHEAEAVIILKVLQETNWNLKQAAKELDIARGTLYGKMKKYGFEKF